MSLPKISTVLVCDDIRKELSGKFLFIGIYANDILVKEMPSRLALSFWFVGKTKVKTLEIETQISIKPISGGNENKLFAATNELGVEDNAFFDGECEFFIAYARLRVEIEQDSYLIVKAKPSGGRWATVQKKRILLTPENPTWS